MNHTQVGGGEHSNAIGDYRKVIVLHFAAKYVVEREKEKQTIYQQHFALKW